MSISWDFHAGPAVYINGMDYSEAGKIGSFLMKTRWIKIVLISFIGCSTLDPQKDGTDPVDHAPFTDLLTKYVNEEGLVDYGGFVLDKENLDRYLQTLSTNPPNGTWSHNERLAYWINVYNAFTISLVLDHYPIESIRDIGANVQIPFINTPWDIKFVTIGEERYTLNNIEHSILRKLFDESRIHFVINCASMSCPKLLNKAYDPEKLEVQLASQTREFLRDSLRNHITPTELKISKIFKWFGGDFTKDQSKIEFIDRWTDMKIAQDATISYLKYDWTLNEQTK